MDVISDMIQPVEEDNYLVMAPLTRCDPANEITRVSPAWRDQLLNPPHRVL